MGGRISSNNNNFMDNMEIARSYSEKISLGNYCMADFFASAKCECDEKDADQKSQELYEFCREQVKRDIENYKQEIEELKIKPNDAPRKEISLPE